MARGGARPGAGRKKGKVGQAKRELAVAQLLRELSGSSIRPVE